MTVIDWPEGCDCRLESGMWREPLVALSSGLLTKDDFAEDFGTRWRATVVLQPRQTIKRTSLPAGFYPQPQCCRGQIEQFIRDLHGGVNTVEVWDFDYDDTKPWGTGRSLTDQSSSLAPGAPTTLEWTTGARRTTDAGWGRATGTPSAVGKNPVLLSGMAANETVICAGDTLRIGSETRLVTKGGETSSAGRVYVTVNEPFSGAGGEVEIGARYKIAMRLLNRDAGKNVSDVDNMPIYRLELKEAAYGA